MSFYRHVRQTDIHIETVNIKIASLMNTKAIIDEAYRHLNSKHQKANPVEKNNQKNWVFLVIKIKAEHILP